MKMPETEKAPTDIPPAASPTALVAVDAARIVRDMFPDLGLRTWRGYDSAGKIPRGRFIGGRKLWLVEHLKLWAEWGFPCREDFEARMRAERAKDGAAKSAE